MVILMMEDPEFFDFDSHRGLLDPLMVIILLEIGGESYHLSFLITNIYGSKKSSHHQLYLTL